MKGEYVREKQDHNSNMFSKLHQTQKFHHPYYPSSPSHQHLEPTFHLFHVSTPNSTGTGAAAAAAAHECQTSEETDSHLCRSPTTTKNEDGGGLSTTANDGATIELVRRPRGRPPGSKNRPKPPVIITQHSEPSMSPYILELPSGVDIINAVKSFCRMRNMGLCILNGSGAVANVTLRQPSTAAPPPNAAVTFHGRFDILSMKATILSSPKTHTHTQELDDVNGFTISLAGPQGHVFGGAVTGELKSAGVVHLIAVTFNSPSYLRLVFEDEARNNIGGGNEMRRHSPPEVSGGGGDGGNPPAAVDHDTCGVAMYSSHLPSDVIWAPVATQPLPY